MSLNVLRKLYQKRLALHRELCKITARIAELEGTSLDYAVHRVHHKTKGCGRRKGHRVGKETTDWSLVDCIVCQKRRLSPKRVREIPMAGGDWRKTIQGTRML